MDKKEKTIVICHQSGRDDLSRSSRQKMWMNQITGLGPLPVFYSYHDAAKRIRDGGIENLVIVEPDGDHDLIFEMEKRFPEVNIVILTSDGRPKKVYVHADWFLRPEQLAAITKVI